MTARERYLETLLFGTPDRIPFEPGRPREKTVKRWNKEGLPENRNWFDFLCETIGIDAAHPTHNPVGTEGIVNFRMNPQFEEKVIGHKNGHYIIQDWMGNVVEISDEYDYTYIRAPKDFVTRRWISFPVNNRQDFEDIKKRYNPNDLIRYPENFNIRINDLKKRDYILTVNISGPFWQLREWCGFEPLCMLFLEDPDFVNDMTTFWSEYVSQTMARILDTGVVDRIWVSEDMAFKGFSMISPEMVRHQLKPVWDRWVSEAKQAGVKIIDIDSDGYIGNLIPIWVESGFNVCDPIEVAAGNDISHFREQFRHQISYRQGVDKRCIAQGGQIIENELSRLEPVIKDGGYIPGCDHGVPYDISWPNFVYYSKMLAELTGWV